METCRPHGDTAERQLRLADAVRARAFVVAVGRNSYRSGAQVGGVLVLNSFPDPENYLTFFARIENAKFKRTVVPGDVLIFKLELLSPIRRGISHMIARAYVNDELTTEAEMKAKIIEK